jgi:hypothetical protein
MISYPSLLKLMSAISMVESGGNTRAYNPEEHAVGHLQIRQCVIDDVNRIYGTHYVLIDAYKSTKANNIFQQYLNHWTRIADQDSMESAARTWVGGPEGWWELSTLPYWHKVEKELYKQGRLDSHDIIHPQPKNNQAWQPPQISPSPAVPSASTPDTIAKSSSRSDLAITFTFDSNAKEEKGNPSTSSPFTIKLNVSLPAQMQASQPPTLAPAKVPGNGVVFEVHFSPDYPYNIRYQPKK